MVRVIALCGAMRAGKDETAAHLVACHGFVHMKLAARLKAGVGAMFGFSPEQLELACKDDVDARWGITPRRALQWVGTDVMQSRLGEELLPGVGREFWVRQCAADILAHLKTEEPAGQPPRQQQPVVISDMRFAHEARCLRDALGDALLIVRVTRAGGPPVQCSRPATGGHRSETEWRSVEACAELRNEGTLEQLRSQVDALLRLIHERKS